MWIARVRVTLKPSVLDPQGTTVRGALGELGYAGVREVRMGKYFEIRLDGPADRSGAEASVRSMCDKLLANPVIERFDFDLAEEPAAARA